MLICGSLVCLYRSKDVYCVPIKLIGLPISSRLKDP